MRTLQFSSLAQMKYHPRPHSFAKVISTNEREERKEELNHHPILSAVVYFRHGTLCVWKIFLPAGRRATITADLLISRVHTALLCLLVFPTV